jgi:hypothetical protein
MGFSIFVETLNLRVKARRAPVHLRHTPHLPGREAAGEV